MDSPLDQFDKTDMVLNPITVGLAVLERCRALTLQQMQTLQTVFVT